jgi:hypothetical protein
MLAPDKLEKWLQLVDLAQSGALDLEMTDPILAMDRARVEAERRAGPADVAVATRRGRPRAREVVRNITACWTTLINPIDCAEEADRVCQWCGNGQYDHICESCPLIRFLRAFLPKEDRT